MRIAPKRVENKAIKFLSIQHCTRCHQYQLPTFKKTSSETRALIYSKLLRAPLPGFVKASMKKPLAKCLGDPAQIYCPHLHSLRLLHSPVLIRWMRRMKGIPNELVDPGVCSRTSERQGLGQAYQVVSSSRAPSIVTCVRIAAHANTFLRLVICRPTHLSVSTW